MEQVHARQYGMIWTFLPFVGNYITDSEQAAGVQTLPNLRCKNFRYVDFEHLVMRKWFVHLAHPSNRASY